MKLILLSLLVCSLPISQSAAQVPRNHLFKFEGIKNGFEGDLARAKEELANALNRVAKHNVSVISLDENGANWFSGDIDVKEGCPEEEIRELLSRLKENDSTFTRDFKMELMENFYLEPKSVEVEWLGPCSSQYDRKRSGVLSEATGSQLQPLEETNSTTTTTTTQTLSQEDDTTPTPPAISSSPETTTSQIRAATTTETPDTEIPVLDSLESLFSNLTSDGPAANTTQEDGFREVEIPTDSPTTTTETPDIKFPAFEPTESTLSNSTPDGPAASTTQGNGYSEDEIPKDSPITATTTQSTATTQSTTTTSTSTTTTTSLQSTTTNGKYIGLAAAFALSVAYFLYSRAYRRHGMYELQQ